MSVVRSSISRSLGTRPGEAVFKRSVGLLYHDRARRGALRMTEAIAGKFLESGKRHGQSSRMDRERLFFAGAVLETVDRIAGKRLISREFMEHASLLWTRALVDVRHEGRLAFIDRTGFEPPWVLVVAPTSACNLQCPGCYSSAGEGGRSMPFEQLDRLICEARDLWGIKVVVFTGGEPLLYRSEGKGILDLAERHGDLLCLVFTNGTLIDDVTAARFGSIGTPTAAISVEGLRESTDARRGEGSFDTVLEAMARMRDAGALTGISITATRENCEEVLSDDFLDFFFEKNDVAYGFLFQYMPEGRDPDPSLMPTPEQRLWMWKRSWEIIEKKRIVLFDFWNHGTLIGGCVAAGRERGYIYVDWDGNVMPCVFAPYSACNIHDIYSGGGTLNDAWDSPFLSEIREWQRRHAACDGSNLSHAEGGRMVCACPVRDHYSDFREMVVRAGAEPVGGSARWCLSNPGFEREMIGYGRDFAKLGRPLFAREYDRGADGSA